MHASTASTRGPYAYTCADCCVSGSLREHARQHTRVSATPVCVQTTTRRHLHPPTLRASMSPLILQSVDERPGGVPWAHAKLVLQQQVVLQVLAFCSRSSMADLHGGCGCAFPLVACWTHALGAQQLACALAPHPRHQRCSSLFRGP
jgi:hypothetical protein